MTPTEIGIKIMKEYWNEKTPVNIVDIAIKLGLKVFYDRTLESGGCLNKEKKFIRINPVCSKRIQRYTIARYLGEYVLDDNDNYMLDLFIAEILMPRLAIDVGYNIRNYDVDELSKMLDVSTPAICWRLRKLGYI